MTDWGFLQPPRATRGGGVVDRVFEEWPVTLTEFVQGDHYLANPALSDIQYEAVLHAERVYYAHTFEYLARHHPDPQARAYWKQPVRFVNFLDLEWGKGSGKDHVSRIAVLRVCYLLLCLRSPQDYYEMPGQDSIHVLNVAVNSKQAQRAFFGPLRKAVTREGCWFQQRDGLEVVERKVQRGRPRKVRPEGQGATALLDVIRFGKGVEAVSGHSDADSQEGLNLILGVADEIDAFKTVGELEKTGGRRGARESSSTAEAILQMLQTSASTRFETYKNIRISWPRYLGSKIQLLVEEGRADNEAYGEESRHYVSGPKATWEVNPRVKGKEQFAKDYRDDPVMSRARYECKPSYTTSPYFANEPAVRACTYANSHDLQPLEVDYVREGQAWRPLYRFNRNLIPVQGARYAMHADLAVDGCRAGVAVAHVKYVKDIKVTGSDEQGVDSEVWEARPCVKVDFCIGFEADKSSVPPREIQIRWVSDLLLELRRQGWIIALFTADQWQCLSGDTRIPLLDGTTATMRELAERTEPFWVYSVRDGRVVPGKCVRAWRTAYRHDMLEVELDNGEKVRATSDHRFMLRDGTYRRARDLRAGDSLMPLYRRLKKVSGSSGEYEQVWHPERTEGGNRWMFTHSMVSRYWHGPTPRGWVTHHKNCDERDNSPGNLQRLTNAEHTKLHRDMSASVFSVLWQDPAWRQVHCERLAELRRADKGKPSRRGHNTARPDVTFEQIRAATEAVAAERRDFSWRTVAQELGIGSQWLLYSRVKEAGYPSWKVFRESVQPPSYGALATRRYRERQDVNHKVAAVRLAGPEDVYDLEVEEHHNFATEAGVFVHNSTDMLQRMAAAGIETDKFSLDRDEIGWKNLRDLAYEGRLEIPNHELMIRELLTLSRLPNGKVDHPAGGCFSGDTRVPLLDGREVQIQELADGRPVWVYASDVLGRAVPALAVGRRTKQVRQVCDVVLDTGAVARCTPEHLWRLQDGTYKEAQYLTADDRLLPLNRKWDFNSGYEKVWTWGSRDETARWTHHMVREHFDGRPLLAAEVSHHDNENKRDNRPENLVRMDRIEHLAHHTRKRHAEDEGYVSSLRRAQRAYWGTQEARDAQRDVMASGAARQGRERKVRALHAQRMELLRAARDARSVGAAARRAGLHRNSALAVLQAHGYADWEDFRARDGENHRIRFVELVELEEPVWVYDLEVDTYHNFALTAGVFVHNSKDLADAVGGAVTGALLLGGREDEKGRRAYPASPHAWHGAADRTLMPIGMPDMHYLVDSDPIPEEVKDREMEHLYAELGIHDYGVVVNHQQ